MYDNLYKYLLHTKIGVSDSVKKELGKDTWKQLLKEFVGLFHNSKYCDVKGVYEELCELYGYMINNDIISESDMILEITGLYRECRKHKKEKQY